MLNDFWTISFWWFLLFGLGIAFLPLNWLFFKNFWDLGYPFVKIVAILLVSYLVWLSGSLRLLPFRVSYIWITIFALALGNIFLARKFRKEFIQTLKPRWKILIFEEILFFASLTFWSFIRGFQPDIEGLEKFMDFGFVNSILRSQYFPPLDMWMAGKTINYYYFGHLVAAVLTKISGLDSAITYNLMIATLFAFAFAATFSLGTSLFNHFTLLLYRNKVTKIHQILILIGGILSALLLALGGNLHLLWWFLTHNFSFKGYWYPDATRFIVEKFGALDNTIHEFPIYSFVVSDLHGHVSDIPFVLLFLALLFSLLISNTKKFSVLNFQFSIPLAVVLGVMYMTNSWDFPIYLLFLGLTIFCFNYLNYGLTTQLFAESLISSFFIFILSLLFSLPFSVSFSQIAKGVAFVNARSPFWQLLVLWGYQWFISLTFLIFLIFKKPKNNSQLLISDLFVLILISVATLLIIVPEFIYVKDIYIASHHRANTMFKFVYQSFMMYALASGYIIPRLFASFKRNLCRFFYLAFIFPFLFFILFYSWLALNSYYGDLKTYRGLYGLLFLKTISPNDYKAILWLKKNIKNQPVVLEASGDSYTLFNRVSALTGLPTIQGWLVHEWLWRGSFEEPQKRANEVKIIYETENKNQTLNLLKKYRVQYAFIGEKEKEKYKISEEKFAEIGKIVFQSGQTKIYKIDSTNL